MPFGLFHTEYIPLEHSKIAE